MVAHRLHRTLDELRDMPIQELLAHAYFMHASTEEQNEAAEKIIGGLRK